VENVIEVRYAGVVVGRSTKVRDWGTSGAFIGFAEPLPSGTSLVLRGDGVEQPARVVEVVESADPAVAGMQVEFVSAAEAARPAAKPAAPAAKPAAPAPAGPPPAVAPVVVAEAAPVEISGGASSAAVASEVSGPASGEHGEGPAGDSEGQPGQGGGKRRRRRR
jgi:hypothetical protein